MASSSLINLSKAFFYKFSIIYLGAPVFISNPHFYNANPKFLKEVEGLNPQKELHETYFKIQPVSNGWRLTSFV